MEAEGKARKEGAATTAAHKSSSNSPASGRAAASLFNYSTLGILGSRSLARHRAAMSAKVGSRSGAGIGGGAAGLGSAAGAAKWGAGGKKQSKKRPRLLKEPSISSESSDLVSALKSSIACPSHILKVVLKQTDLDEPSVHSRYMRFRKEFPTGFVSQQSLHSLCSRALSQEESDALVAAIFQLYGRNRKGWHSRFIGFREVILATECMRNLSRPERVLRWIFKVNDFNGIGAVAVGRMEEIVKQILNLCITTKKGAEEDTTELHKALVQVTMTGFKMRPYDKENITEEEFVFDCLNNEPLYSVLNKSILLSEAQAAAPKAPGQRATDGYIDQILARHTQQYQQGLS